MPTIAVATDGGVSVINNDGTVTDSASTSATISVTFVDNNRLLFSYGSAIHYVDSDDYQAGDGFGGTSTERYTTSTVPATWNTPTGLGGHLLSKSVAGNNLGLLFLNEDTTSPAKSMVAYTTSDFTTGWMNGDIKLTALASTDDTDLVGDELVTNGEFETDLSGWTLYSSNNDSFQTLSNNRIRLVLGGGEANVRSSQAISTLIGQTYRYSVEAFQGTSSIDPQFKIGTISGASDVLTINCGPSDGTFTGTFTATSTTTYVTVQNNGGGDGDYAEFDNISVQLTDPDRSVNNNGLIVNGTVTREPVAPGAELMAYSGFSPTDYLEQPYNSDLDFGTGDFCVMGWVKGNQVTDPYLFERRDVARVGAEIHIQQVYNSGLVFRAAGIGTNTSTRKVKDNAWHFVCGVRKDNVLSLYIDAQLDGTGASAGNVDNANAITVFGTKANNQNTYTGSMALWRISATAPSPEQIAKIYEDELKLFQPNAACTLYGTSDAVTALAHDPVTDLLHVGTSGGRSVFDGLERVSHRPNSVSTAISAVGGLVVEK